jgi:Rieske Fe-S protein
MSGTQGAARIVTRRTVVAAAGAVGLGAALVACGDSDSPAGTGAEKPAADANAGSGASTVLAKTSDIPEGGGKVFDAQKVVVTQPKAGEFKAFSAVCTHQGCTVKDISNGIIHCPCHGSMYSVADGSVKGGPAPEPLPAKKITVEGGSIKLA